MLEKVFEPIKIGNVEIPNRIVMPAHGSALSSPPGLIGGEDFIAYQRERAKGGIGLTILEAMTVHPSSQGITLSDDRTPARYREIVDAVRPFGTKVFQQLLHMGHLQYGTMGGYTPWAVSGETSPTGVVGKPITKDEIQEIVGAFAAAAGRCRDGGLDGVELHCSHGTLAYSFMNPLYNERDDEYGGSPENCRRFAVEIMRAVRDEVGHDIAVGLRVGASEMPGAVGEQALIDLLETLEAEGLVDYVLTSMGDFFRPATMTGGMELPPGYMLPSTRQIMAGRKVPTIAVGRIKTLEEAERIIAEGTSDLVAMARALIADPELVNKSRAGRADEVRPCIACNQGCQASLFRAGARMSCTVNPVVGYEARLSEHLITATPDPKRVLVVGGGPAGLEAARIAALEGHQVTLVEATSRLGGGLEAGRRAPRYGLLGEYVDWLKGAVAREGVDVRLETRVAAADVDAYEPDTVIVATGSTPRVDGFQPPRPFEVVKGVELPHVVSSEQLLHDGVPDGARTAVVLDTVGHFESIGVAEYLIDRGLAVTYVTSLAGLGGPTVAGTFRDSSANQFLYRGDFTLLARHTLAEIRPGTCLVRPPYQDDTTREVPADVVVLITQNAPNRGLYDELAATGRDVRLVGDADSPRDLTVAVAEGHRAARAL